MTASIFYIDTITVCNSLTTIDNNFWIHTNVWNEHKKLILCVLSKIIVKKKVVCSFFCRFSTHVCFYIHISLFCGIIHHCQPAIHTFFISRMTEEPRAWWPIGWFCFCLQCQSLQERTCFNSNHRRRAVEKENTIWLLSSHIAVGNFAK